MQIQVRPIQQLIKRMIIFELICYQTIFSLLNFSTFLLQFYLVRVTNLWLIFYK